MSHFQAKAGIKLPAKIVANRNSDYVGSWHIAEVQGCYILGPVAAA